MKFLTLLLVVFLNNSCISQKSNTADNRDDSSQLCPEGGTCNFEILRNKSFELSKDDIGMFYPRITDAKTSVLKFEFKTGEIVDVPDSGYTEIVYIEIGRDKNLSIENDALKQVKASYGRLCFCRGESGYFPIEKGKLTIMSVTETQYEIEFEFEINAVPQTLKQFKVIVEI